MEPESGGHSIAIPFDSKGAGRFELEIYPDQIDSGDAVVLALDHEACRSFAAIFSQLAEGGCADGYHIHLGWSEMDPFGPGLRIVLAKQGRING